MPPAPGLAALGILGEPRHLEVRPNGLSLAPWETQTLEIRGRTFPGTRSNLSRPAQGTTLRVADPSVVEAAPTPGGNGWSLRSRTPGISAVEVRVGAASRWIGVRVVGENEGPEPPPVDVTDRVAFSVEAPREPPPEGGFALRQTVEVTNRADKEVHVGDGERLRGPDQGYLG